MSARVMVGGLVTSLLLVLAAPAGAQVPAGLPLPDEPDAAERAWAGRVATAAGDRARRVKRFTISEPNGGANRVVARGVRVELAGLVVDRLRFPSEQAARGRVEHAIGEARGRQAVLLRGERAGDRALVDRVVAAAWEGLGATPPRDAPRPTREGPPPRVVVVGVDARSLRALGRWSAGWREHHAALLGRLNAAGARGVAFDMTFGHSPEHAGATAALARAARASAAPVVMGVFADVDDRLRVTLEENAPVLRGVVHEGALHTWRVLRVGGDLEGLVGSIERRRPEERGELVALGEPLLDVEVGHLRPLFEVLALRTGDLRAGDLERLGLVESLPVGLGRDEAGRAVTLERPGFRPVVADPASVPTLSYVDVLQGRADAATLRGALVLVGLDDGVTDVHEVSSDTFCGRVSGVYFHAFALRRALAAAHAAWRAGRLRQDDPSPVDEVLADLARD